VGLKGVVVDVADSTFTADFEGSDLKLTGGRGSSMVCNSLERGSVGGGALKQCRRHGHVRETYAV
jgi:hypothetical protein